MPSGVTWTKEKQRVYMAAWKKANPERKRALNAKWQAANPEKVAASKKAYYAANREEVLARKAAFGRANTDKSRAQLAAWRAANPERNRARASAYRSANREKHRAYYVTYMETRSRATPKWLSAEQREEILVWYRRGAASRQEVDHIVPLQGRNVSGLHVPWNLQLLSKSENVRKGNRH